MKFNKPVGSFVVLTRNERKEVFLVKRSDFSVWEPQGGGIENNETAETAAIREAYEETGFKIEITRKIAEYKYPNSDKTSSYIFEGKYISGSFKPEYDDCEGKWFNVNNLPLQMTAIRKLMIKDCLKNNNELIHRSEISKLSFQNMHLLFLLPLQSIRYIYSTVFK